MNTTSGPVLTSGLLVVLDHSVLKKIDQIKHKDFGGEKKKKKEKERKRPQKYSSGGKKGMKEEDLL